MSSVLYSIKEKNTTNDWINRNIYMIIIYCKNLCILYYSHIIFHKCFSFIFEHLNYMLKIKFS